MDQKFCPCEPGDFPAGDFYADPSGAEYHFVPGATHFTSTCDEVSHGSGPGTLVYKLILGSILSEEESPIDFGPAPLEVDPNRDIFEIVPDKSAKDLVDLLKLTDRSLSSPQPLPEPVVRVLGDLVYGQEQRSLIQMARSGQDIMPKISQDMENYGLYLSGSNLDLIKDFLLGGMNDLSR